MPVCKKVWTKTARAECRRNAREQILPVFLLVLPFQGRMPSAIVLLFSFDAVRGNILHLSSNFTLLSAGKSLHYHWKNCAAEARRDIIHRIAIKERQFLRQWIR
ncbi:hypothetical protein KCP74_03920 [Salmonella enterica subsp. enterica]|nr:hypothetical protein KCP74_03920 [Salmonella enterica subsp. enterica]